MPQYTKAQMEMLVASLEKQGFRVVLTNAETKERVRLDRIESGELLLTLDLSGQKATFQVSVYHVSVEPCAVCKAQPKQLIQIEVRDEDGPSHWFSVCSEDCLHEVASRWTQVCEIDYPEEA